MPLWLTGALSTVGGFFTGLANLFLKLAGYLFLWRTIKRLEELKAAKKVAKIKDKQLEIASKPPLHRSDLLERMRKRKRT